MIIRKRFFQKKWIHKKTSRRKKEDERNKSMTKHLNPKKHTYRNNCNCTNQCQTKQGDLFHFFANLKSICFKTFSHLSIISKDISEASIQKFILYFHPQDNISRYPFPWSKYFRHFSKFHYYCCFHLILSLSMLLLLLKLF